MVPSVRPGAAPSAEGGWAPWAPRRVRFPGGSQALRPATLLLTRPAPPRPRLLPAGALPLHPAPGQRAPVPPRRARLRISWNSLSASGTNTSPLEAAAPPKTLAPGTSGCSHLWAQAPAARLGSAWPECARPKLEARNT